MPNTVNVTSINPASFFENLQKEILDGYYADESVSGSPKFDTIFDVQLTETLAPEQRNDLSRVNKVVIEGFNDTTFLLDVQDAILQGFRIITDSLDIAGHYTPHRVSLERVEDTPVGQPTVSSENSSEEATEVPKPVNKGGRPRKQVKE